MVRVPTIDDVRTDADLVRLFQLHKRNINWLCHELALTAATIKAMLRDADRKAGKRRAARVSRPVALAAGVLVLVSKYMAVAARRFTTEYAEEIGHERRRSLSRGQSLRFERDNG